MRFSNFNTVYSQADWRILELAHRKAYALLDRDPKFDPQAERVALTIMILFERSLLRGDIGSDEIAIASMFLAGFALDICTDRQAVQNIYVMLITFWG